MGNNTLFKIHSNDCNAAAASRIVFTLSMDELAGFN